MTLTLWFPFAAPVIALLLWRAGEIVVERWRDSCNWRRYEAVFTNNRGK